MYSSQALLAMRQTHSPSDRNSTRAHIFRLQFFECHGNVGEFEQDIQLTRKEQIDMAVKVTNKPPIIEEKEELPPPELVDFEVEPNFEILEPRKMVPFPAKNIEANKDHLFWEWQEKLVEDDWNHLVMYLFREWPYIDRQRINPKANINIEVIGSKFSKNSSKFLTEHGSGKYKLLVNDINKAVNGKGGTLGTVRFEVNDPEYPPIFVLEELATEHPSNRGIVSKLVAEGKLTIEGKVMTQNNQGGGDNAALIALLTRMIEKQGQQPLQPQKDTTADNIGQMYVKASDSMMSMLKDQIKSDDPDKLIKMLSALKEMMPKPETENSSLALIMKMQGDMAKVQSESQAARESMMLKMMEMMNAKQDNGDAEDKILARIATYKELFGGSEGGNPGKRSTLEVVLEHAAPAALKVMDIIGNVLSMQNFKAGLAKNGQAPVVVQNPAQIEQPQQQQPKQEGDNVVEMPKAPEDELIQVITMAGPLILKAIERKESGDMFAQGLEQMYGTVVYEKIVAVGKDKIIEAMKQVPLFWEEVKDIPQVVEKFVVDFIAYKDEEEEE